MTRILLVRHGESEYNSARRFAGHVDVGLTETGLRQVERLRQRLADEKIDAVYSSDLKRAQRTAEVLIQGRGMIITTCPELREISYGEVEGLPFSDIQRSYPELAKQISNTDLGMKFPGGESFLEFVDRVDTFRERLKKHSSSETLLVVAHGGPLRALVCDLLGIGQTSWWQFSIDNASLTIIQTYPRGAVLSQLNETFYLKESKQENAES